GAALDLLHHEEGPVEPLEIRFEIERLGHRKPRRMEGAIGVVFDVAFRLDQACDGIAAQDERTLDPRPALLPACAETEGFAAGAAVNTRYAAHLDAGCSGHPVREIGSDAGSEILHSGPHFAGSRMSVKPEGACGPTIICSRIPQPLRVEPSGSVITASEIAWM